MEELLKSVLINDEYNQLNFSEVIKLCEDLQ